MVSENKSFGGNEADEEESKSRVFDDTFEKELDDSKFTESK
jgi:hypothetical protein